jgi:hypothetical protein
MDELEHVLFVSTCDLVRSESRTLCGTSAVLRTEATELRIESRALVADSVEFRERRRARHDEIMHR